MSERIGAGRGADKSQSQAGRTGSLGIPGERTTSVQASETRALTPCAKIRETGPRGTAGTRLTTEGLTRETTGRTTTTRTERDGTSGRRMTEETKEEMEGTREQRGLVPVPCSAFAGFVFWSTGEAWVEERRGSLGVEGGCRRRGTSGKKMEGWERRGGNWGGIAERTTPSPEPRRG